MNPTSLVNYYEILGIPPTAGADDVRTAYRKRISQYHPDRNSSVHATAIAALLNEAWAVLGNPARRREYDAKVLSVERPEAGPAPEPSVPAVHHPGRPRPRSERLKTLFTVWVTKPAPLAAKLTCVDLSMSGMAITFPSYIDAGNLLNVTLDLPFGPLDTTVRVVRCDPLRRRNRWKIAVTFSQLDADQSRQLAAFIEWEKNERVE